MGRKVTDFHACVCSFCSVAFYLTRIFAKVNVNRVVCYSYSYHIPIIKRFKVIPNNPNIFDHNSHNYRAFFNESIEVVTSSSVKNQTC